MAPELALTVPAPDGTTFALFVAAAITLLVIQGPAVLYIVAQSINRGRGAGLVSTLGIATGSLVHVTAAAFGLSSLLVSSARGFDVVRYAGAAYLIYLGVRRLLTSETPEGVAGRGERTLRTTHAQGVGDRAVRLPEELAALGGRHRRRLSVRRGRRRPHGAPGPM